MPCALLPSVSPQFSSLSESPFLLLVEVGFLLYHKEKNFLRPTSEDGALGYGLLMMYN